MDCTTLLLQLGKKTMRPLQQIAEDWGSLDSREMYLRFYHALPVQSPKFQELHTEIHALAKHAKEGIKL